MIINQFLNILRSLLASKITSFRKDLLTLLNILLIAIKYASQSIMENYMLPCLNKKLFGIECLGCGIQRAFLLLFKGEFVDAFYMYPAIYPLLLLTTILGYTSFFELKYSSKIISVLAILSVSIILVNYALKHFL